jgi:hypothetical protein
MAKPTGAAQHGPILSPIETTFGSGHEPAESCVKNGLPGVPKGSDRIADCVTLFQGGNFGKVKNDQGKG